MGCTSSSEGNSPMSVEEKEVCQKVLNYWFPEGWNRDTFDDKFTRAIMKKWFSSDLDQEIRDNF